MRGPWLVYFGCKEAFLAGVAGLLGVRRSYILICVRFARRVVVHRHAHLVVCFDR